MQTFVLFYLLLRNWKRNRIVKRNSSYQDQSIASLAKLLVHDAAVIGRDDYLSMGTWSIERGQEASRQSGNSLGVLEALGASGNPVSLFARLGPAAKRMILWFQDGSFHLRYTYLRMDGQPACEPITEIRLRLVDLLR